ncbi:Hypothetical protein A7982_01710 [Minicystis rosea]|nr:Hypothetical protein A7982_01710 [Minicystis rosea]
MHEVAEVRAPIRFRGQAHRAPKTFWEGTQRVVSPEETFARIRPKLREVGVTRLADITGLDRLGIPVVLAIRPNAGYLSVDAGKGFTKIAASTSAAMECLERHAAEQAQLPERYTSYDALREAHATVPFERLPLARGSLFHARTPTRWSLGWDLVHQREVAVPADVVTLSRHRRTRSDPLHFQLTSNGLSAGNNFLEALNGGLLEVIERDAVACRRLQWESAGRPIPRVRTETIERAEVVELIARLRAAGVEVLIFDCTVDTDVPVYMAFIYDREVGQLGLYRGYGAHLDPGIALVRAITEAVQGRLVFIAGSRDDAFRHHRRIREDDRAAIRLLESIEPTVSVAARETEATSSFEGDVDVLAGKLARVGLDQIIVFDLSVAGIDVDVLRVFVPGLEGYMYEHYQPGQRASDWMQAAR